MKELISMQERAFRQTVGMFATNMKKEDINSIRKTVDDLKCSLNFSQRDIDDIKFMLYKAEEKVFNAKKAIFSMKRGIDRGGYSLVCGHMGRVDFLTQNILDRVQIWVSTKCWAKKLF